MESIHVFSATSPQTHILVTPEASDLQKVIVLYCASAPVTNSIIQSGGGDLLGVSILVEKLGCSNQGGQEWVGCHVLSL